MKRLLSLLCLLLTLTSLFAEKTLTDFAKELKFEVSWDYWRDLAILKKNGTMISFRPGEPLLLKNYQQRVPVDYIERDANSEIVLGDQAIASIQDLFREAQNSPVEMQKVAAIILDAGHGGRDSGAVSPFKVNGRKILEKDIALDITKKVYSSLKKQYPDKKILLTRSGDTYPTLGQRTDLANSVELGKNEAKLFVSIHVNASLNKKSNGFEVWYLPPEMERDMVTDKMKESLPEKDLVHILNRLLDEETSIESIKLATTIKDQMKVKINGRSPDRGLKENAWYVVRNAKMPSVLVEVGFISNVEEAHLLDQDSYRTDLAVGIYNGIHQFIQQFELSNGFTTKMGDGNEY